MKRSFMKKMLSRHRQQLPDRKRVVERGQYPNAPDVPVYKENAAAIVGCGRDAFVSKAMEMRQWTEMMSRIGHAKGTLSHCVDSDPLVMGGVPVVKGTRMPVGMVLADIADDMRLSEIAEDLSLDRQSLVAILQYLATVIDRPANEYHSIRRMRELETPSEFMYTGGEHRYALVPERTSWQVD